MNNRMRQRLGKKHFKNRQVWSLSYHLSHIILGGLRQFRYANKMGTPIGLTMEGWNDILDQMIWSFTEISRDFSTDPFSLEFDKEYRKNSQSPMFNKNPDGSYKPVVEYSDELKKEQAEYCKQVQKGLDLFAKYYCDLWD